MAENLRQERDDQAREDLQYDRHYPPDRGDSRVIAEFKGTRFQRTTYLIKLIGRSGSAKISAHSKPNAERICRLVTKLHGEFESRFWLATGVYLKNGFSWVEWEEYQKALSEEGAKIRGDRPLLKSIRHQYLGWSNEKAWRDLCKERRELYQSCNLYPKDAPNSDASYFIDVNRLVEASPMPLTQMFSETARLSEHAISVYLMEAQENYRSSAQLSSSIAPAIFEELKNKGLIEVQEKSALDLLDSLRKSDLIDCLKHQRGVALKNPKVADLTEYMKQHWGEDFDRYFKDHAEKTRRYVFNPLKGMDWEQFQDFRHCYTMMIRWYNGWVFGYQMPPALMPFLTGDA